MESVEAVATYHDPCELGRLSGIFEPPREVLRRIQGLEFKELPRNRFTCRCCGGGGLIEATNPDIASKMRTKKLDEAKQIGAEKIVSSCPSCFLGISEAIDERGSSTEMLDIAEIAASAIGLK